MKSKSILALARDEIKDLTPCIHGGNIWNAKKYHPHDKGIIDFSANVNPLGPSQKAIKAVHNSLWQIPFYPDPNSIMLREAISHHLGEMEADNIIVGNGSTELIYLFCETFLKKGDSVLMPAPTFGEYENAAKRVGCRSNHVNLGRDFKINPRDFIDRIDSSTKVIFLCNPNNPTSILTSRNDLLEIIEKASRKNVIVFLDEDFIEFVDKEKRYSLTSKVKNYPILFILRSFTKVFGLAGLRIGYGIACEDIIDLLFRVKVPWNINCLAQAAAIATLKDKEYLKKTQALIKKEKKYLLTELEKIRGLRIFPADANFIFIDIRQSGFTAPQLKEKMLRHGILIRDCSSFKGLDEYYIRVSVRTRQDNEKLLAGLEKVIGGS